MATGLCGQTHRMSELGRKQSATAMALRRGIREITEDDLLFAEFQIRNSICLDLRCRHQFRRLTTNWLDNSRLMHRCEENNMLPSTPQ